jgi:hypothetical protein
MANSKAIEALDHFAEMPTKINTTALIDIPVLHDLLAYEFGLGHALPKDILAVCQWLSEWARTVLGWLRKDFRHIPPITNMEKPWTEVNHY